MRRVAGLLIRDANVTLDTSELNRRVEQFVSDAYGQEAHLAQVIQIITSVCAGTCMCIQYIYMGI